MNKINNHKVDGYTYKWKQNIYSKQPGRQIYRHYLLYTNCITTSVCHRYKAAKIYKQNIKKINKTIWVRGKHKNTILEPSNTILINKYNY